MKFSFKKIISMICAWAVMMSTMTTMAAATEYIDVNDEAIAPIYTQYGNDGINVASANTVIVILEDCRVYKGAGSGSEYAGKATKGIIRTVHQTSNGYYKIKLNGDYVWVAQSNTALYSNVIITITSHRTINVYETASTSSVLTTMPANTTRTVLGYSGNYYQIKMNGKYGYVKMTNSYITVKISGNEDEISGDNDTIAGAHIGYVE